MENENPNDNQSAHLAKACELAQRYYRKFYATCFWFCPPELQINSPDALDTVVEGLRSNGGRAGWNAAREIMLCL
jgi:hypothetical protein